MTPLLIVLAVIAALISGTIGLTIYFLPTLIAVKQHHRNALAIGLLNGFLGWSIVGWVVALVWAVYREQTQPR